MISITRDSGFADMFRNYQVVIDGIVAGEIGNGKRLVLKVPPGKHQMQIKIDWCTSNTVAFEADEKTREFQCGSNLRGIKLLLSLLFITLFREQYIWLRAK